MQFHNYNIRVRFSRWRSIRGQLIVSDRVSLDEYLARPILALRPEGVTSLAVAPTIFIPRDQIRDVRVIEELPYESNA